MVEVSRFAGARGNDLIKCVRTAETASISLIPTTGLNGSSNFDLELSFSLSQTLVNIGGALSQTVTNPGYTDGVNMFQEWKIDEVEVMILFSNNASQINNVSILPIFQIVADYVDSNAILAPAALQYENLRVVQLGNYRGDAGPIFKLKPKYLVGNSVSTYSIQNSNNWLSTLNPAVPHFGVKMVYDPSTGTSSSSVGVFNLYIRYHFSFRKTN